MKQERQFGGDAVRALALLMVITVHFFLNTEFYSQPLMGPTMAVCAWVRMAMMPCVPLFLMLSGCFCAGRRWSLRYLLGLLPILLTYILSGVLCLAFRKLYLHETLGRHVLRLFLEFSAAPYAWYVAMYLGLYLLMPFMNVGWQELSAAARIALLVCLFLLSSLPTLTNNNYQAMPDFWLHLYPAAYYLLGCWLREPPGFIRKIPGWALLLGWLALAAAATAMQWDMAAGSPFAWTAFTDFNSPFVAGEALCAFVLISRVPDRDGPRALRRAVSFIAQLSLPIYLLSYIFDALFYPILNSHAQTMKLRMCFLPLMVLAVLICSAILAWPVDLAARRLKKMLTVRGQEKHREDAADEH